MVTVYHIVSLLQATLKLPAGEPCDNEYLEPDGRMCSLYYNLVCAECPGTEDSICLEPYEISDGVTETPDGKIYNKSNRPLRKQKYLQKMKAYLTISKIDQT